jgi:hypothetical protein
MWIYAFSVPPAQVCIMSTRYIQTYACQYFQDSLPSCLRTHLYHMDRNAARVTARQHYHENLSHSSFSTTFLAIPLHHGSIPNPTAARSAAATAPKRVLAIDTITQNGSVDGSVTEFVDFPQSRRPRHEANKDSMPQQD